jgi:SagB-type dehydrogenase family enzyme
MIGANVKRRPQRRGLIRRARCLVAFWEGSEFVVENYLTGKQTRISPLVGHILQEVDSYEPREAILQRLAPVTRAAELLEKLVVQTILIRKGSAIDARERLLDESWAWGHDARFFHCSSKRVCYEEDLEVQRANLAEQARQSPPPSPFKEYQNLIEQRLPGRFQDQDGDFWAALQSRRTKRRFSGKTVSLSDFSTILRWTWGSTHFVDDPGLGPYVLKTSPSGGARHPIEVYPVVLRVEGVEPGIYHYSVKHHGLDCLRRGDFRNLVVRLCFNQGWVRDAAVVFFMTAVLGRTMWKYKQSFAYRVIHLDAGHLGQTFHLVCTKLGLAPFTTAATRDDAIERLLGLDGISEVAIYTAAVGGSV